MTTLTASRLFLLQYVPHSNRSFFSPCAVGLAARLAVVSGRGTSFTATVHALTTTVLRLTTLVALATSIDGRNFMPTTRSKAASFEEIAFSVFSEAPSHAAAPVLFDCLQQPDGLLIDQLPAASALSEDDRQWIKSTLLECGFELKPDGSLHASEAVLDKLRKEQNSARKRAHAEAAASREILLTNALRELEKSVSVKVEGGRPLTLAQARGALSKFLADFNGQPAVGPLLLGLATLLKAQAGAADGSGRCWVLERAAVLNGGDAFVKQVVPLFGQCGVRPVGGAGGADAEAGLGPSADEMALQVRDGVWSLPEMQALASFVERKCKGSSGGFAGRASGRVDAGSFAYTARENASLAEWLATLLSAWLTRFAP